MISAFGRIRLICVLLLLCMNCGTQRIVGGSSDTEVSARVAGCIVDSNGKPVSGVEVQLRSVNFLNADSDSLNSGDSIVRKAVTDTNGEFSFDSIPVGNYSIVADGGDSTGALISCEIIPGKDEVTLTADTLERNAVISGNVVLYGNSAIPRVQVYGLERSITPDSTGFFRISLPAGSYRLKFSGPKHYDKVDMVIDVASGEHKYLGYFWLYPVMPPPCPNYSCDSSIVRAVLDSCGKLEVSVDSVTVVRNGRIVELNLRGFGPKACSPAIGFMNALEKLDLGQNQIKKASLEFIGGCYMLQVLKLDENQIQSLPDMIGTLVYLRSLDLSDNALFKLPDLISNLKPYESLKLTNNQLCDMKDHLISWADNYDHDWRDSQQCTKNADSVQIQ